MELDFKHCARCERYLPREAFRPDPKLKSGLSSWCRECFVARTQQWRAENPEQRAAANAARRLGPFAIACGDCGETFDAVRRDQKRCPSCQAAKRGGEYVAKSARRKAQKLAAPSDLSDGDVLALYAEATDCPMCGVEMNDGPRKANPRKKHLDHIEPLNVGGAHVRANVRVICAACNLSRPKDGSDVRELVAA